MRKKSRFDFDMRLRQVRAMQKPYFFGYGSLVNRKTHVYQDAHPAKLKGWRRVWRQTTLRPRPLLTAEPCPGVEIEGLVAHVPNGDWQSLDQREFGYDRIPVEAVEHSILGTPEIATYSIPATKHPHPGTLRPIALSYLDVVVQGYLAEFGPEGARAFFDTTVGWEAPIENDRANPIYPRSQNLSSQEMAFVDSELRRLGLRS